MQYRVCLGHPGNEVFGITRNCLRIGFRQRMINVQHIPLAVLKEIETLVTSTWIFIDSADGNR